MIECGLVIVSRNTHRLLLPALTVALGLILTGQGTAQTFTNLYSFTGGSDGGVPYAGLILSGNTLYGTTAGGGSLAVSGGAVWLLKTGLTAWIEKDTEAFKARLKADADTEIERLKNSLQMAATEHQVRFSKMHEKRAKVIEDVYTKLTDAYRD